MTWARPSLRVFFTLFVLFTAPLPALAAQEAAPAAAKTFRLATMAVVRETPEGLITDVWAENALFTAHDDGGDWLRISGTFPDDRQWQPLEQPLWVLRAYAHAIETRQRSRERYIVIHKNDFLLRVIERRKKSEKVLYETTVTLGMDGCKPKELGGRCYYTDPGEYQVRWKVHDPSGIEWCIPKYMEDEYPEDIANGQRCFRGPLGYHALNIGKSYAIHGTNRPDTLGQRASHGCIRVANHDMEAIYRLAGVGDKVLIVE